VLLGDRSYGFISDILDYVVLPYYTSVLVTSHLLVLPLIVISRLLNSLRDQCFYSRNRIVDLEIAIGLNPSKFTYRPAETGPMSLTEISKSLSAENFAVVQQGEWLGCTGDLINNIIGIIEEDQLKTSTIGKSKMAVITAMEFARELKSLSGSLARKSEAGQKLIQVQIQIIYNLLAQQDNKVNIEIAAATKRDSTAMKAIAIVTMVFLPGAYIATLFSMSMFNWEATDGPVLSHYFWVYWAVTVPVTILVLSIWALWSKPWK